MSTFQSSLAEKVSAKMKEELFVDAQLCWLIQEELRSWLGNRSVFVRVEASFTAASIHFYDEEVYHCFEKLLLTVGGDVDEVGDGPYSTYLDVAAADLPNLYEQLKALPRMGAY